MMLSKQFSSKLQADLFGILAMDNEPEVPVETSLVRSPTKVPLPFESVPLPPVRVAMASGDLNLMPPPPPLSPPSKPKFLSVSLPNSATSSPRFNLKKWRNDGGRTSPRGADTASPNFILTIPDLHRSKSCGEGRLCAPPSVDFDALLRKEKPDTVKTNDVNTISAERPPPPAPEEFKCGALCLFLPGFGKGKPVRAKKSDPDNSADRVMISRTVSLEKFECGSWASSAVVEESTGGSTTNLYFDLPLEMIRTSGNETNSPVAAAFVFEKELKGVLKNGGVAPRKSSAHESGRHVRFSTSSPRSDPTSPGGTCITPRLRKAREDFNAFLEAQSAYRERRRS